MLAGFSGYADPSQLFAGIKISSSDALEMRTRQMPRADGVATPSSPTIGYLVEDGRRRQVEGPRRTWPGVVWTCTCRLTDALGARVMGDGLEMEPDVQEETAETGASWKKGVLVRESKETEWRRMKSLPRRSCCGRLRMTTKWCSRRRPWMVTGRW